MKRILLSSLLLVLGATAWSAEASDSATTVPSHKRAAKAIAVEVVGTNLIGVTYDSRFRGHWGWGYRVGLGYNRDFEKTNLTANGSNSSFRYYNESTASGLGVPLEINYLVGRRLHQFECGVGTTVGLYKEKNKASVVNATWEGDRMTDYKWRRDTWDETHFGWYAYGNVGYRFHTKRGFLLRLGSLVGFGGGDHTPYRQSWSIRPYLSLGYTFPNAAIGQKREEAHKPHVPDSIRIRGYRGFADGQGGTIGEPFLAISTTHGFRFNRQWFVGAGVALSTEGLPVFANARFNLTKRPTAPVLDARLGYDIGYLDDPLYITLGFGVDHRFTRKLALSFLLHYLHIEEENGWMLQLGVEF